MLRLSLWEGGREEVEVVAVGAAAAEASQGTLLLECCPLFFFFSRKTPSFPAQIRPCACLNINVSPYLVFSSENTVEVGEKDRFRLR